MEFENKVKLIVKFIRDRWNGGGIDSVQKKNSLVLEVKILVSVISY